MIARRQRRARPAKREHDAEPVLEPFAEDAAVPNSSRSTKPTTTGGSTSGRCTIASSRIFPGKSLAREHVREHDRERQARHHAEQRDLEAQQDDLRFVSWSRRRLGSPRVSRSVPTSDAPRARRDRSTKCRRRGRRACQRPRLGIDDGRMRACRKRLDDAYLRLRGGVGGIDDAERRLAARDQDQRGANVLACAPPCLRPRPRRRAMQRGLRVLARGHTVRVGQRESLAIRARQRAGTRARSGSATLRSAGATSTSRLRNSSMRLSRRQQRSRFRDRPSSRGPRR